VGGKLFAFNSILTNYSAITTNLLLIETEIVENGQLKFIRPNWHRCSYDKKLLEQQAFG